MTRANALFAIVLIVISSTAFAYWSEKIDVYVIGSDGRALKNATVDVVYQSTKCGDHVALSKLMETALGEAPAPCDHAALLARSDARLRRNGEAIWAAIRAAIATRKVSA